MAKTQREKVLAKVVKTPRRGGEIAEKLGLKSHHPIAKDLNELEKEGKIARDPKRGYYKV